MRQTRPTVDIVIPVLNEARILEQSVTTLRMFLERRFPYSARIVIADNGSTDGTRDVAERLVHAHSDVDYPFFPRPVEAGRFE